MLIEGDQAGSMACSFAFAGATAAPAPLPRYLAVPRGQVGLASAALMDLSAGFDLASSASSTAAAAPDQGGHQLAFAASGGYGQERQQGGTGVEHGGTTIDSGLSQDDLDWLEHQLSLAAQQPAASPPSTSFVPLASPNGTEVFPHQPHAFPPVSSARFHPYQLPPERAQRIRPPGPTAQINLVPPHLQHHQQQFPQPHHHQHALGAEVYSGAPANDAVDALHWPSFSSFASSFAPVVAPPPAQQQHYSHSVTPHFAAPGAKQLGSVLYPPQDAPSPVLLPDAPTPPYPLAPHASPATPSALPATRTSSFPPSPLANGAVNGAAPAQNAAAASSGDLTVRRPRACSAPPTPAPPASFSRTPAPRPPAARPRKAQQLSELFAWLDAQRWSFATLFSALSDLEGSPSEHERRLGEFLEMDEPLSAANGADEGEAPDGAKLLREAKRRWALKRRQEKAKGAEVDEVEERGPDEVVRMWEEQGGLGRRREGTMVRLLRRLFV